LNLLLLIALAILFFHHLDITSVVYKLYTTKIKTGSYINPVVIKWLGTKEIIQFPPSVAHCPPFQ